MLTIAQIGNRPQGSVSDVILAATVGLAKNGHQVTNIFTGRPVDHQAAARFPGEVIIYADPVTKQDRQVIVGQLRRTLLEKRYDVVIAHRYHPCKITAQACRGLPIKRRIAVFHGLENFKRLRRKAFARLFLRNWQIAGVSQAVVQDILHSKAGFKPRQVHTVSNGLDIKALEAAQLSRMDARKHLGLPQDDLIFGNIGRLSDSKNQEALIDAFARIVKNLPSSSRLVIIGEGRRKTELLARVTNHGLQDRVLLKGFVPKAQQYLKAFDLFLFPSRSEAFGLALLEAMVARVPAIVSKVGGICELVGDYPFTHEPDDIQTLAMHMKTMARKSAAERDRIAGRLHNRAKTGFDITKLEEAYLNIATLPQRNEPRA
jgi:glycosyltransferase involved in cell wall biosynthesis